MVGKGYVVSEHAQLSSLLGSALYFDGLFSLSGQQEHSLTVLMDEHQGPLFFYTHADEPKGIKLAKRAVGLGHVAVIYAKQPEAWMEDLGPRFQIVMNDAALECRFVRAS